MSRAHHRPELLEGSVDHLPYALLGGAQLLADFPVALAVDDAAYHRSLVPVVRQGVKAFPHFSEHYFIFHGLLDAGLVRYDGIANSRVSVQIGRASCRERV